MTLFIRVVDLCDSLEELQVICDLEDHQKLHGKVVLGAVRRPQYVLPIPAGRHVDLRAIALSNADQNTWTKFPIPTGTYGGLEEITLSGFRISKDLDPDALPALPRLQVIRYESCDLGQTDRWLLRCTQLRDLQIDLSIWEPACRPPALLAADSLRSLQVSRGSAHYRFFEIAWVARAQQLRALTVDWETLQKGWQHLPVCLNELCVILKDEEPVDRSTFEDMLPSVEGSLKKLILRLNKTHEGVKVKEAMIELGKKHSIEVEFDVMSFSRGGSLCFSFQRSSSDRCLSFFLSFFQEQKRWQGRYGSIVRRPFDDLQSPCVPPSWTGKPRTGRRSRRTLQPTNCAHFIPPGLSCTCAAFFHVPPPVPSRRFYSLEIVLLALGRKCRGISAQRD
jgi:hypothetical protein